MDSKPVIIVGGGLSGLAAAVELTSLNIPVLLLEQKPKLGGRAYSFVDSTTGDVIDNGQHVLIAGYERTMSFLEKIGTKHLLSIQDKPRLVFHHPTRGFCEFTLPRLPSPFHLVAGILSTNLFPLADKFRLLRAGFAIQFAANDPLLDEMTIEEWLNAVGQSAETSRSFWEPLAISIMNEHVAKASAKVFVNSLRHAFLGGWKNSAMVIPLVGLSELYVDNAVRFIREHGGDIRTNADVVEVVCDEGRVQRVKCKDGEAFDCKAVVFAAPHYRIKSITPALLNPSSVGEVESTPIISIHLWFENDFMQHEVVGIVARRVQWIFNKGRINRTHSNGGHISCVISGAERFVDLSNDELVAIAMNDLRSVYTVVHEPIHSVVVREKRATISCTPTSERLRPNCETSVPNLFLAGDWTGTGLPATIEGAIISGERCAELIVESYV